MITLEKFSGIAPGISPYKLSDAMATLANNVRFDRHRLDNWKGMQAIEGVAANTASIFPYNGSWLTSTFRRHYVRTIIPNDVRERIVFTDSDYPKIRSGAEEYRLGIPSPSTTAATLEVAGDKSDPLLIENWSYIISYVDAWGAEGPTSQATNTIEVGQGGSVRIVFPTVPTGDYNFGAGALIRIYRTNTGATSTEFQYVDEVAITSADYVDSALGSTLQEVAPSVDWIGPPDDDIATYPDGPLLGLVELPNGVLAGYSGNSVHFSQPYLPHAWPLKYRKATSAKIKGLVPIDSGLLVLTEEHPYLIIGTLPDSMILAPMESDQACVSENGYVDMGGYALYPSPDGLVRAQGNTTQIVSSEYFTKEAWQALTPETFRAFKYDDKYLAFYGDVTDATGFVFDPRGQAAAFSQLNLEVNAGYQDPLTDKLYLAYIDELDVWQLGEFDAGSTLTFEWQCKIFRYPRPTAFNVISCKADAYPVDVEVFADGVSQFAITLNDDTPRKIPGGFKAREWQLKITSSNPVDFVGLFKSMAEAI